MFPLKLHLICKRWFLAHFLWRVSVLHQIVNSSVCRMLHACCTALYFQGWCGLGWWGGVPNVIYIVVPLSSAITADEPQGEQAYSNCTHTWQPVFCKKPKSSSNFTTYIICNKFSTTETKVELDTSPDILRNNYNLKLEAIYFSPSSLACLSRLAETGEPGWNHTGSSEPNTQHC